MSAPGRAAFRRLTGACLTVVLAACASPPATDRPAPSPSAPAASPVAAAANATAAAPRFEVLVHSELGMHCTGFDFTYCCVLPPYNSVLAQVVRIDGDGRPTLLGADPADPEVLRDGERRFRLAYTHVDGAGRPNTHSEHKKMVYWGAEYDGRTLASEEFRQLYSYDPGTAPTTANAAKRRVGEAYHIMVDRGPTNRHVGHDVLRWSGPKGTVLLTDSRAMENVPIELETPDTWAALGLPLTPFSDYVGSMFFLEESDVRPFQRAVVSLVDADTREPIVDAAGRPVSGFGVNAIDVPACDRCHASDNANGDAFHRYETEYAFWRDELRTGDWFARLKAASISILEIHDARHGTSFTARYPAGGTLTSRLGRDSVRCQDCHADNVVGVLQSKRIREIAAGDRGPRFDALNRDPDHVVVPLTEAIHRVHQTHRPLGDAVGLSGACQGCHPAHRDDGTLEGFPLDAHGHNAFADGDNRDVAGGCFAGRDVHANPGKDVDVPTPGHLNAVGQWLREQVCHCGTRGEASDKPRGLWCTHCHNKLSRALYAADHLTDAVQGTGTTLRNQSLDAIAAALGIDTDTLVRDWLDPRVPREGPDRASGVVRTWDREGVPAAPVALLATSADGRGPRRTAPDVDGDQSVVVASADPLADTPGIRVPYDALTDGKDYWLAAGEPHCADCHAPPFVESEGGRAFPIDQPGKYALMRHSTGHAGLHCQSCHGSAHGLFPVTPKVDTGSYAQAAANNPDGTHGPTKCAACHAVNADGVPLALVGATYRGKPLDHDYDLAVEWAHAMRGTAATAHASSEPSVATREAAP